MSGKCRVICYGFGYIIGHFNLRIDVIELCLQGRGIRQRKKEEDEDERGELWRAKPVPVVCIEENNRDKEELDTTHEYCKDRF